MRPLWSAIALTSRSGSLDNVLKTWDVETGKARQTLFGHTQGVWQVAANALRIVSASHDRTLKIWNHDGTCMHTLAGHRGAVTAVTLSDDAIVSGSDDATVHIWSFR